MTPEVQALVDLLDLEELDHDLFRGKPAPNLRGRTFGGQVAAQALTAAIRAADAGFGVHSMHSYFLLPGDPLRPIIYEAERIRDGRSFQTRRVVARQQGRPIYYLTANFQVHEEGYDHQDAMPQVPPPEAGIDVRAEMLKSGDPRAMDLAREWGALDGRWLGDSNRGLEPDERHPSRARLWMRIADRLPDDPHLHLGMFTFASDVNLLGASLAAHGASSMDTQMASLDHAVWFHRPFRADEWWLYDQESPSASGGRGLSLGKVFTREGLLVATVAQEGVIRPLRR